MGFGGVMPMKHNNIRKTYGTAPDTPVPRLGSRGPAEASWTV
jgi:hypothetical protein